jgi:hypothetical protein
MLYMECHIKKYTNLWLSILFKYENASSARVDSLPPGTLVTIASWSLRPDHLEDVCTYILDIEI